MTDTVLTDEQIESFVEHGYVTIPECFSPQDAQPWLDEAWIRLGYDPSDPSNVVLMHPYMLHAVSQNRRGTARFITNPPIALKEPMRFDRADRAEQSPVERAVLRALGVDRLDYRPTAVRESVVPERVLRQQRTEREEQVRLAEASS
jgi:hypothetical protein